MESIEMSSTWAYYDLNSYYWYTSPLYKNFLQQPWWIFGRNRNQMKHRAALKKLCEFEKDYDF